MHYLMGPSKVHSTLDQLGFLAEVSLDSLKKVNLLQTANPNICLLAKKAFLCPPVAHISPLF